MKLFATMTDTQTPKKPQFDVVIPDYSNAGVAFRVLFAVNAIIFPACIVPADSFSQGARNFIDAATLVELACLTSIIVLYGMRRLLLVTGVISAMSPWAQRLLCAIVPALITGVIVSFMRMYDWFRFINSTISVSEGVVVGALFGAALQHYFELRSRAFSPALSEARLQALQARIRPHFLFNSLNAVLSLIRKEPRQAETALEDLAELFRVSMRDAHDMTTLDEELRFCRQYLSIEKIRLGDRLQVEWDTSGITDDELRSAQIATLMLQPLLENAVNYGVEPSQEPTLIEVKISCSMGTVEILVKNPVPGVANTEAMISGGNRMALGNIRERLALLYDVEAELASGTVEGRFEVRLRFPFKRRLG
jgi:two-component system, LytTR family, sensor histidine kinase AlgZ